MRIAYLIQCHKNAEQVNLLVAALDDAQSDFYIHVDKKSDIQREIAQAKNVYLVSDENRIDVRWGQISQVEATLQLIKKVVDSREVYDYVWLMSGQDLPIKPKSYIRDFLMRNSGSNFISVVQPGSKAYQRYIKRNSIYYPHWLIDNRMPLRIAKKTYTLVTGGTYYTFNWAARKSPSEIQFHFGSSWWTLSYDCVCYILHYVCEHPEILEFFKHTVCPDESFFQTIVMNSPFKTTQKNNLTFVDWSEGKRNPKTFGVVDYNKLMSTEHLFARKFDLMLDPTVVRMVLSGICE